jgi:large conductance mechanosensitive channel
VKGFREFLLRGNLVELAVAVIVGTAFAAVVKAFTDILLDIIGKVGGQPDFSRVSVAGISLGPFLSALFAFLLTGFVLYFFVALPYNRLTQLRRAGEQAAAPPSTEDLLTEIRDLLRDRQQRGPTDRSGA